MDKKNIRKKITTLKQQLTRKYIDEYSLELWEKFLNSDYITNSQVIMSYMSFGNELNTYFINNQLKKLGKTLLLPRIEKDGTLSARIDNDIYSSGAFGIKEPTGEIYTGNIDLIIMPGLAFDTSGNRIGYGKGYYDKFLTNHKKSFKVAFAFEFQIFDSIPKCDYDVPVDCIYTKEQVFLLNHRK